MTYKQALEASKHNPAGVIEVLEKLSWDCPECDGTGYEKEMEPLHEIQKDIDRDGPMERCDECDDGKIKYCYSPQVGEWTITPCVLNKNEPVLITGVDKIGFHYAIGDGEDFCSMQTYSKCTPILPWETIEEILEKAGYIFSIKNDINPETMDKNGFQCIIEKGFDFPVFSGYGKFRLPAVYEAVLALGKELKC